MLSDLFTLFVSCFVDTEVATVPDSCDVTSMCPMTTPPPVIPTASVTIITTIATTTTSPLRINSGKDGFLDKDGASIVSLLTAAMVAVMLLIQVQCTIAINSYDGLQFPVMF